MKMQKASVKTVSIIDTLSELVQDENEANQLTSPAPPAKISLTSGHISAVGSPQQSAPGPPQLKPRSPHVRVPNTFVTSSSPNNQLGGGDKFLSSSDILNLSAIPSPPVPLPNSPHHHSSTLNSNVRKKKLNGSGRFPTSTRGQTPEWIKEIFAYAKSGLIEKLSSSLENLEPTLIRNLTEHNGNNLLHVTCAAGHANLLPWLTRKFGKELNGALLNDENRKGFTPAIVAIKLGKLDCVKWLVRNTSLKSRLRSKQHERQRSLLHVSAKYGQDAIVSFLCDEMVRDDIDIDQLDIGGNSPLHLAAREGKTSSVAILLNHGSEVGKKNDMGLRAYGCAKLSQKFDCAEYLLLFETSLSMSRRILQTTSGQECLQKENQELKSYFRDVLHVAKKLVRERDEMCKEMARLYDTMMELHNNMTMEIQVLTQENSSLKKNGHSKGPTSSNIEACTTLHERWQQNQKAWFSNSLVEHDHKLMMAEEGWKRVKSSYNVNPPLDLEASYYHRHLRDMVEEMRLQSHQLPTSIALPLSSSEDNSWSSEDESFGDHPEVQEMKRLRKMIAQRKKLATPSLPNNSSTSKSNGSLEESVYSSLSNDMYTKIGSPANDNKMKKNSDSNLSSKGDKIERKKSREELRKKLREHALTSEKGNASVLEVIEPDSSEEEEFKKSIQQMNLSWTGSSFKAKTSTPTKSERLTSPVESSKKMSDSVSSSVQNEAGEDEKSASKKTFLQKLANWKRRSARKEPLGGTEETEDDIKAEEHVLPDTFEDDFESKQEFAASNSTTLSRLDVTRKGQATPTYVNNTAKDEEFQRRGSSRSQLGEEHLNRKSLSPSSRKSLFGSKTTMLTDPISLAASEDSGIVLPTTRPQSSLSARPESRQKPVSNEPSPTNSLSKASASQNEQLSHPESRQMSKLGKIEEVSVSSASRCSSTVQELNSSSGGKINHDQARRSLPINLTPLSLIRKKSIESKAWYDVPSEDEQEVVDEADSLASIISIRGQSSDED